MPARRLGAEVIKVEPTEGDAVRTMGKRHEGASLYAASILRNKSLIALDLRSEGGDRWYAASRPSATC